MLLDFPWSHDVKDLMAASLEIIRNQSPMALPPKRFGAHDSGPLALRKSKQPLDAGAESVRQHIIGVAAESSVAPGGVGQIRLCAPAAAQFGEMKILDADACQRFRELLLSELRMAAGTR